jgi:hypothetical protein
VTLPPSLTCRCCTYEEVCFFLTRFTVSRFSTLSNVCDDSKIFMYAASVSAMVLSYSFREAIYRYSSSHTNVKPLMTIRPQTQLPGHRSTTAHASDRQLPPPRPWICWPNCWRAPCERGSR